MLVNEQIWLQELGKGEDNAYRELFRLFYARLGNLAFHFVEERAVAEDIVQDTFLMACAKVDLLVQHPNPGGWLVAALKKNIYNYWRMRDCITNIIVDMPMEDWLNNYHQMVFEKTSPYLTAKETSWLAEKTKPIS